MAFSSEYTLLEDLSVELRGVNTFLLWVSAQWTRVSFFFFFYLTFKRANVRENDA